MNLVDVIKAHDSPVQNYRENLRSTRIEEMPTLANARHRHMLCKPSCHRSLQLSPKSYELVYKQGKYKSA